MYDKRETERNGIVGEVLIVLVITLLAVIFLYTVSANTGDIRDLKARAKSLEAEVATLKRRPEPPDYADELAVLSADIDVCHLRVTDIWGALGVVARTVPGRARPPRIPKRDRPSDKGETSGRVPRRPGGP